MILTIPEHKDGRSIELQKESEPVEIPMKRATRNLIKDLKETCLAVHGLGLAAPQVGEKVQVAVIYGPVIGMKKEWLVMVNPSLQDYEDGCPITEAVERCLSYPGLSVKFPRVNEILITSANEYGHHTLYQMDGMQARVFLHEYEHLKGVTIASYIGYYEDKEEWLSREGNQPYLDTFEHLFEERKEFRNEYKRNSTQGGSDGEKRLGGTAEGRSEHRDAVPVQPPVQSA
jgi:peptide deformylase